MAGLRDTAAAVAYIQAVPASTMAVAMVTDDDLLLQRVRVALDREGLIAHVEQAGRHQPDLDGLERHPDVVLLAGSSCREPASVAHGIRRRMRDVHVVLLLGADADCATRHLLDAGVDGIVAEAELEATVAIALRAVCAGHLSVPRGHAPLGADARAVAPRAPDPAPGRGGADERGSHAGSTSPRAPWRGTSRRSSGGSASARAARRSR